MEQPISFYRADQIPGHRTTLLRFDGGGWLISTTAEKLAHRTLMLEAPAGTGTGCRIVPREIETTGGGAAIEALWEMIQTEPEHAASIPPELRDETAALAGISGDILEVYFRTSVQHVRY